MVYDYDLFFVDDKMGEVEFNIVVYFEVIKFCYVFEGGFFDGIIIMKI